jgi:hypothetical protein
MNQDQKLAFISGMTDKALMHMGRTPNVAGPDGKMSHEKMASFVAGMAKNGLQHFDVGGPVAGTVGAPAAPATTSQGFLPSLNDPSKTAGSLVNPLNYLNGQNESIVTNDIRSLIGGTQNQFQAGAAPIQAGTNAGQINQAYTGAQGALQQQQGLVNEVQPGVQQGVNTQGALGAQLANEAAGGGPNPAAAALAQQTGQNIAQQAALAAGQRGAGANAGFIASQNAQQGAATQQNAIGQAATLEAQQQLNAQNAEQNLASTQVNQGANAVQNLNTQNQGEQSTLQGANASLNSANVANQGNINNVNASVSEANQTAANKGIGGLLGSVSSIASIFAKGGMVRMDKGGNVLDAEARSHIAPHNFALPGGRYPIHDENHARNALARVSQNGTPDEKAKVRAAVAKKYPGIGVKKMADGGTATNAPAPQAPLSYNGAGPDERQARADAAQKGFDKAANDNPVSRGIAWVKNNMASGGEVLPVQSGPQSFVGSWLTAPKGAQPMACGGMLAASGGKVSAGPGEGAVKSGDSLKNDKVPAMLSQGEIVIPRHITMGPNAAAMAAQFVANELKKRARK